MKNLTTGPSFKPIIPFCKNCLYFKEKIGEMSARCSLLDDRKIKYQLNVIGGYESSPDSNCPFLIDNKLIFLNSEIEKIKASVREMIPIDIFDDLIGNNLFT